MCEKVNNIGWEPEVESEFKLFVAKMPVFHRRIAEQLIREEAQKRAIERNATIINEEDFLNAVFDGVPKQFYTLMLRLLKELKIDYKKYGLPKVNK